MWESAETNLNVNVILMFLLVVRYVRLVHTLCRAPTHDGHSANSKISPRLSSGRTARVSGASPGCRVMPRSLK